MDIIELDRKIETIKSREEEEKSLINRLVIENDEKLREIGRQNAILLAEKGQYFKRLDKLEATTNLEVVGRIYAIDLFNELKSNNPQKYHKLEVKPLVKSDLCLVKDLSRRQIWLEINIKDENDHLITMFTSNVNGSDVMADGLTLYDHLRILDGRGNSVLYDFKDDFYKDCILNINLGVIRNNNKEVVFAIKNCIVKFENENNV